MTLSTVLLKSVIALDFAAINKALIQFVYRFHCETIQGVINWRAYNNNVVMSEYFTCVSSKLLLSNGGLYLNE